MHVHFLIYRQSHIFFILSSDHLFVSHYNNFCSGGNYGVRGHTRNRPNWTPGRGVGVRKNITPPKKKLLSFLDTFWSQTWLVPTTLIRDLLILKLFVQIHRIILARLVLVYKKCWSSFRNRKNYPIRFIKSIPDLPKLDKIKSIFTIILSIQMKLPATNFTV